MSLMIYENILTLISPRKTMCKRYQPEGRKGEDCRASWEEEVGELLLAVDDGGSLRLLFYGEEGRRGAGAAWLLLLSMEK